MADWWNALTGLERFFAYAAIPASVLLVIQVVLQLFGLAGHHDGDIGAHGEHVELAEAHHGDFHAGGGHSMEAHHDGAEAAHDGHHDHAAHHDPGLRIFTLRGLVAFFAVGGWTGIALLKASLSPTLASAIALVAGFLAMTLMALLMKEAMKLQSDGSIVLSNAMGQMGNVYITVPARRSERGKVTVLVQEQLGEYDAVTDSEEPLKTGTAVKVVGITNGNTLVVSPL